MALEFTEDFEGTLAAWGTAVGTPTITTDSVRAGVNGLKVTGVGPQYLPRTPSPATPTVLVDRFYFRIPTGGYPTGTACTLWLARTAIPTTFRIRVDVTTHNLQAQIGSGTVQTFGVPSLDTWYYVDVRVNSTNGTIDWQVNGVAQTQATGTTGSTFSSIRLGCENATTGMTIHYDDIAQSQTSGDYPIGALVGGGTGIVPLGMSSRLASYGTTVTEHANHPWLKMVSIYLPWKNVNTARATYDWSNLNTSINDADTNGYKVIIRVLPAIDASPAAPSWIFSDATNPVASLQLVKSGAARTVPVPWDANLRVLWRLMLADLKTNLDANNASGHPRKNYVAWMATSMPCFPGTEMWTVDETDDGSQNSGFPGTGNMGAWMGVTTGADFTARNADRISKLTTAWDNALDDMVTYIPTVRHCVAGGSLFPSEGQAKAKAIPAARVGSNPTLIMMETNGQPKGNVNSGSAYVTGTWKSWCSGCHDVIAAGIAAGLNVGMQTASQSIFDRFTLSGWTSNLAFQYMARDLTGILVSTDVGYPGFDYPLIFLEPNPGLVAANEAYSRDVAQPAIMAQGSIGSNLGPPAGTIISPPSSLTAAYFAEVNWTDPDGVALAELSQDAGGTWPDMNFNQTTGNWGLSITLSGGVNTLLFRATDSNASPLTSTSISYDVTYTAPPTNTAVPTITPTSPIVGQAVTSTTGSWTGTPNVYTYTWQRKLGAGSYSTVQTGSLNSYIPVSADIGYVLRCQVVANNGQDSAAANSADSASVIALSPIAVTKKVHTPRHG